jgi:hypothetical protein
MQFLRTYFQKPRVVFWSLIVLALGLRLIILALTSGAVYDLASYHLQAESVFTHRNVYLLTDRYPYPPVWVWLVSLAQWGASITGWSFAWFVKLPGIIGDVVLVVLLWRRAGVRAALFYACNPVSLLITAGHGQFDGLVLALVVAAWVAWTSQGRAAYVWASLALGAAVAFKGYPLILLPALLVKAHALRRHLIISGLAFVPLIVALLVYGAFFGWAPAMVTHVLGYSSYPYFGWALYVDVFIKHIWPASFGTIVDALSLVARAAILLLIGLLLWRRRDWPLERFWLASVLSIYVLAPGIAVQYFLWALPAFAMIDRKRGLIYTAVSFLVIVFFYLTQESGALPWGAQLAGITSQSVWLSCYVLLSFPWWLLCIWLLRGMLRRHHVVSVTSDAVEEAVLAN